MNKKELTDVQLFDLRRFWTYEDWAEKDPVRFSRFTNRSHPLYLMMKLLWQVRSGYAYGETKIKLNTTIEDVSIAYDLLKQGNFNMSSVSGIEIKPLKGRGRFIVEVKKRAPKRLAATPAKKQYHPKAFFIWSKSTES